MPVCRFFLDNKCRFGENCKFEHPRGDAQRNLFGQNDSWGKSRVTFDDNNKYKWTSNSNQQGQNVSQTPPLDLVNNLPKEMELWEKSKMWPFSCISVEKDIPSLPGFYDMSVEELRMEAYTAQKSGNIQPYVERVQTLTSEFQNKRQQLRHITPDMRQKLIAFLQEARNKTPSETSTPTSFSSASQGLFGKSSSQLSSSNPFAQTGSQGAGLFGKSVFGNSATMNTSNSSSSVFGSTTAGSTGSVFGSNTSGTTFGGASTGLFGKSQGTPGSSGSVFGSAGPGLFGKPQEASANPFASNSQSSSGTLFGGAASSANNSANPFMNSTSASATPQTLFGKPTSNQTSSVFGNQSSSVFGSTPAGQNPKPGLLGAAPSSPFGAAFPQTQSTGLLGEKPPQVFGQAGTGNGQQLQPRTLFGKPVTSDQSQFQAPQNLFTSGLGQGIQTSNQPVGGDSVTTANANPGRYTPMDQLTEKEIAEFRASSFTLGKIPLRPPARELINI